MDTYKAIAELGGEKDKQEIEEYLTEQYGKIPIEVENLITVALIKALAKKYNVTEINVGANGTSLVFGHYKVFGSAELMDKINYSDVKTKIEMSAKPTLRFINDGKTNSEMLKLVIKAIFNMEKSAPFLCKLIL
jgi:transcription-repair coupling factor (superfamily II helicase)